ncbi:aminoglycoside adenylyltransferase domain-containing protein [Dactylosporangium sp. McL0621]|uniref:aminoglycoside adenylyltransferase domain-containing protein n=1 Tax=Dactylosporangium sp. McL0621 TaxID=3415678 RepID=UPI003CF1681A
MLDALPGFVQRLYLVGSAALDDYREGASDIDFVAVLPAAPTADEVAALAAVHHALRKSRPLLDGVYLAAADLAAPPSAAPPGPGVHAHRFSPATAVGRDPVTWHTLAHHGVAVRGPAASALDIHTDGDGLRAWTRANIASYWRPWLRRHGLALLSDWGVAWGVLGLARMHYTLSTGGIASKSAAGGWALEAFPEHAPVLREALRLRAGDGPPLRVRADGATPLFQVRADGAAPPFQVRADGAAPPFQVRADGAAPPFQVRAGRAAPPFQVRAGRAAPLFRSRRARRTAAAAFMHTVIAGAA